MLNIKPVKMSLQSVNLDLFYNLSDQIMIILIFRLENQSEIDYKSMLLTYSN